MPARGRAAGRARRRGGPGAGDAAALVGRRRPVLRDLRPRHRAGEPVARRGTGGRGRFLAHRSRGWCRSTGSPPRSTSPWRWRAGLLGEAGALARDPAFVAASFLFWPMARPDGSLQPLYGLGWTLNYEMAFYALFALGLGFGLRGAVAWLGGVLVALVALGTLLAPPPPLAFWADPIVLEFALGGGSASPASRACACPPARGSRWRSSGSPGCSARRGISAARARCRASRGPSSSGCRRGSSWRRPPSGPASAGAGSPPCRPLARPRRPRGCLPTRSTSPIPSPCARAGGAAAARPRPGPASLGRHGRDDRLALLAAVAVHRLVERPLPERARVPRKPCGAVAPPGFHRPRGSLASARSETSAPRTAR